MLSRYVAVAQQPHIARFQFDQRVTAHYFQARILWLQGYVDQAMRVAESNIDDAISIGDALSLGSVLGQGACPIAFFNGDFDAAERFGVMLLHHSERHALRLWHAWARCFNGLVMVKRGDVAAGLSVLRSELSRAGDSRVLPRYLFLLGELAESLGRAGEIAPALETVDETLARCERNDELWYIAELLRIKGELIILKGAAGVAATAEEHFLRALDWAGRQKALSWELRAAVSLARLWKHQNRLAEGRGLLGSVYARFIEGFASADLQQAKSLLEQLA